MAGEHPKPIQSIMRHSTIALTMDTYGHLIEGAEANVVVANADMTSVPAVLAVTGTDGTCIPLVSVEGAKPCVDRATNRPNWASITRWEWPQKTRGKTPKTPKEPNAQGGT